MMHKRAALKFISVSGTVSLADTATILFSKKASPENIGAYL